MPKIVVSGYLDPQFVTAGAEPVRLQVTDIGVATNGTIVFIPGAGGSASIWKYQVDHFAAAGYRTIVVEERGQGQSSKPYDGYDLDTYADDLLAVLDQLDITDATLVGHSHGSVIALHYAARHENAHISKLVLASVLPVVNGQYLPAEVYPVLVALLEDDLPAVIQVQAVQAFVGSTPEASDETVAALANDLINTPLFVLKKILDMAQNHCAVLSTDCAALTIPTCILHGTNDILAPFSNAETVAGLIDEDLVELVEFENSGHALFLSEKALFNSTLLAFITD